MVLLSTAVNQEQGRAYAFSGSFIECLGDIQTVLEGEERGGGREGGRGGEREESGKGEAGGGRGGEERGCYNCHFVKRAHMTLLLASHHTPGLGRGGR